MNQHNFLNGDSLFINELRVTKCVPSKLSQILQGNLQVSHLKHRYNCDIVFNNGVEVWLFYPIVYCRIKKYFDRFVVVNQYFVEFVI